MAEGPPRVLTARTGDDRALDELAAFRHELVASVVRQIDFSVEQMKRTPDEARETFRRVLHDDPETVDSDQLSWLDLSTLIEADAARGQALWQRLKDEAIRELETATRVGRTLERPLATRPSERAAFAAIVAGLESALHPKNPLEDLLIQQMAAAFELQLRWQTILVRRMEEEVWQGERDKRRTVENMSPRERERYEDNHGWLPPRLAETEALEQAQLLSDRYQRSFLRLLKAFRDNRRLFDTLVVAGGQVNIGEQQVNIAEQGSTPAKRNQGSTKRRGTPTRVNKRAKTA